MIKAADFVSELSSPSERWLARVMVHTLQEGFRTAEDFVEFFSPAEIMESLDTDTDLRAKILVEAAGVHERIARKKSTNSAAEDLRIALEEGICSASTVLDLFPPDARVLHLEHGRLWTFLTEDEFWASVSGSDQAIQRVQFMLETALDEELITLQELADGISFEEIAKRLPREDLESIVVEALKLGRKRAVFDEASLVDAVPLSALLGHLALETVWNSVIVEKLAKPADLLGGSSHREKSSSSSAGEALAPSSTKNNKQRARKKTVVGPVSALKPQPAAPPKPPAAPPTPVAKTEEAPSQEPKEETTIVADDLVVDDGVRSPQEEEARKRVADKLVAIDRLPPKHDTLPTGILLSMESMYAELFQLSTDEEREECIRDSFPNEGHLTTAMLALIELLDPSIDITDPVIRDADVASLIKVVLFEERHRAEQSNPSRGSGAPAPPGQSRRPPPLPGVPGKSTPPPLPAPSRAPRPR